MFVIEDEVHAEAVEGRFRTRQLAIEELERLATIPWNEAPNRAPCIGWLKCGRRYEVVEYDESASPWKELSRDLTLEVSATGVLWSTKDK